MSAISTEELRDTLLEELHYTGSPDLKRSEADLWPNGRPIPHIESAYFVQGVPVVYFSRLEDYAQNPDTIWKIYRSVWSQSKVPLLYVITPQEIRVYNGYEEPPEQPKDIVRSDKEHSDRLLRHLQQLTDIETTRQQINQHLQSYGYERLYVETGAFWQTEDGQKIKREKRADQRLLRAMGHVRRLLLEHLPKDEHSEEIAYALLGRSIFIRYLEDRGVLSDRWVADITHELAHDYLSALQNITITYDLFEYLSQRFNGDLFPVNEIERERVDQTHLNFLHQFLSGVDFETGQLPLFPYYDFEHIPIELISGIYDTFLSEKKRKELGAYYTPLPLVDFIIEETLPRDKTKPDTTILDPACGSGVFLVRAYQRLIECWKRQHNNHRPKPSRLISLLRENIFGVDVQLNAVGIATFSLYIALLDYLKNEDIEDQKFRFPGLRANLIHNNFFSTGIDQLFATRKFDRIVGNPPWGRGTLKKDRDALRWVKEHAYPVGEEQIVQAFLWRAPLFCSADGEIVLLAAARSTILVSMSTQEEFRQHFFEAYDVRAVVNFSTLVYELFEDSLSPIVALFYRPDQPSWQRKIVYGVPKPSSFSQHLGAIVLDASDVKYLDRRELLADPALWKIAAWGFPQDAALIKRLQSLPTLRQQAEKYGWTVEVRGEKVIPQGFVVGNKKHEAHWLQGMPCVDTDRFQPYVVETHGFVEEDHFERHRVPEAYRSPLTLIHRSTCEAAFFAGDKGEIAYKDKITGVPGQPGQEDLLKWLTAYLNTPLARYYHFLTSTSWAVERGTISHEEYKRMPFLIPDRDDPRLKQILDYFDQIVACYQRRGTLLSGGYEDDIRGLRERIDNLVFELYDLFPVERQSVQDTITYETGFFLWSKHKNRTLHDSNAGAVQRPSTQMLLDYAETFVKTTATLLGYQHQTLNAVVFQDGAPLNVLEFKLVDVANAENIRSIEGTKALRDILAKLDHLLLEQRNATSYTRRHIRIFDGPRFYLVRPAERRFWSRSCAYADASDFLSTLLIHSRRVAMEASQ